jgi:hypothetical protein
MGFAVLHLDKASGNDAAMTSHIERTVEPRAVVPRSTAVARTAVVPSTTVVQTTPVVPFVAQTQVQAYQVVETPQTPFAVRGLFRDRVVVPRRTNVTVVPVL